MDEQMTAPQGETSEAPRLSMIGRFFGVFFDPRTAFASIRKNYEWIVAAIVVLLVGQVTYQITKPIIQKDVIARVEQQLKASNVSEERRQEILDNVAQGFSNPLWQLVGVAGFLVMVVVGGGILLFLGNILMGGQTNFLSVVNMYALTWLIALPENIVKVPLMLSKKSMQVETSLALLLPADTTNEFLRTLLGKFDLFGLWQLTLVIIGLSVLCRTSVGKSATVVGAAWVVLVLIQAGLASLGIRLTGM